MPGLALIFQIIVPTLNLVALVWILVEVRRMRRVLSADAQSKDPTSSQS